MAAATASAADYATPPFSGSPSMTAARSPDTASPVYPDRAIRPLPKSRLKSKLSPEQSASIIYPPDPPPISPTLHFSTIHENGIVQRPPLTNGDTADYHHHTHSDVVVHGHCTCGEEGDSGDEEVEFDHPDYRYATAIAPVNGGKPLGAVQRRLLEASRVSTKPPPPGSTGSSADGYESFENTSNKKKRKIPLSSASGVHTSLSAGMANMGISSAEGVDETAAGGSVGSHYPQSASGTGISGAGRGRYGRQSARHERKPLANTMNAANGYNSRVPRNDVESKSLDAGIENTGGIISQAIKTAAEQGPLAPQKGQEYGSLLQSVTNSSTPKTQFTFAVESESATKMADQQAAAVAAAASAGYGSQAAPPGAYPTGRGQAPRPTQTQGTQTTPQLRQGQAVHPNNARQPQAGAANQQHPPPPEPKPRPRRRPSKEYALAARQRRLQQEYTNYHQRPTPGNMYICEFCEYEDIFGVPPLAMIRRYEIKDREERKKAAERRRLLEKAKAKNRKGKKGKGKNSANNGPLAPAHGGDAAYDPNMPPGPDGEEYYDEDEYGDEYDPVDGEIYDEGGGDGAYYPPPSTRSGIQAPAPTPTAATAAGRPPPPPPAQPA